MFQINDVIVYGAQGVCRIAGTEEKIISGKKKVYYVLHSVQDDSSVTYVPTDNPLVLQKMRKLLTREEIHSLIDSMSQQAPIWVESELQRKELFKAILVKGDHRELIGMLQSIYAHKQQREAHGKRLHMSDERFFKDAEQLLFHEFQYVLGLGDKAQLMDYITQRLASNNL